MILVKNQSGGPTIHTVDVHVGYTPMSIYLNEGRKNVPPEQEFCCSRQTEDAADGDPSKGVLVHGSQDEIG